MDKYAFEIGIYTITVHALCSSHHWGDEHGWDHIDEDTYVITMIMES